MIKRTAEANWKGSFKTGHGLTTTESRVLIERRFSYKSRFGSGEDEGVYTNPEELIASAAASCFCMALAKYLSEEDHPPVELVAHAEIGIEVDEEGAYINQLRMKVEGLVPGISKEDFSDAVNQTKDECPVFQLLLPGLEEAEVEAELQE